MPIRWLLIFWMFAISAISFLDRVNISIAGRFIQQEFHITDLQLGNVFSAFLVGYALFQTPAGRLADRFGPRLILTLGTLWWGVFTALTAMVSAGMASLFLVLLAVRFSLGAGESVLFPASNRLVANWIPSRGARLGKRFPLRGGGRGPGHPPAIGDPYRFALRMARVVLDQRGHRPRGRRCLVLAPPRPAPGAHRGRLPRQ